MFRFGNVAERPYASWHRRGRPFFVIGSADAESCAEGGKKELHFAARRALFINACMHAAAWKQMFVKHEARNASSARDHCAHKRRPPWAHVYSVTHRKEFRNGIQQEATSNSGATATHDVHEHTKSRVSRVTHRGCTRLYFDYGYSKSKRGGRAGVRRGVVEGR